MTLTWGALAERGDLILPYSDLDDKRVERLCARRSESSMSDSPPAYRRNRPSNWSR